MDMTLLVLAAGMGSRYGGLKQIDPVGPSGEIILDYSIYDAMRAGFNKVVFVIRKDIEAVFRESIGAHWEKKIKVEYAFQEIDKIPAPFKVPAERQKPWGTGHAILMAAELINEPFAVINADDFYGYSAYDLVGKQLSSVKDAEFFEYCMGGFMLRNTLSEFGAVSRGVCECDKDSYLKDVVERTKIERGASGQIKFIDENSIENFLTGNETVSMNMWGFTPSLFKELDAQFKAFLAEKGGELKSEFYIPSVVNTLIKSRKARVKVLQSQDSWFGITYKEDKPAVQASIKKLADAGKYPAKLF